MPDPFKERLSAAGETVIKKTGTRPAAGRSRSFYSAGETVNPVLGGISVDDDFFRGRREIL